jgi:DNA-binding transcriptional regulator YiaG
MQLSGRQILAARTLLGMSQSDLAAVAGVPQKKLVHWESEDADPEEEIAQRIQAALERHGVEFFGGPQPGVRLKPAGSVLLH